MKYVVTDEDIQKAVDAFDDHYTGEAIGGRYFDNKSDAMCAALESFAHTLGDPVAAPDGWQLVPAEPTEEMRLAGQFAHYEAEEACRIEIAEADILSNEEKPGTMRRRKNRAAFVYKRMLSAAPHHPTTEKGCE
jgi:hypothetical protein